MESSGKEPPRAGPLAGEADEPQREKQRVLGCRARPLASETHSPPERGLPGPEGLIVGPWALRGRVTSPGGILVQHSHRSACASGVWGAWGVWGPTPPAGEEEAPSWARRGRWVWAARGEPTAGSSPALLSRTAPGNRPQPEPRADPTASACGAASAPPPPRPLLSRQEVGCPHAHSSSS